MSSTGVLLIVSLLCLIAATRSQTSVKPGHGAHINPPRNTKSPKQKEEKHDCAPLPDAAQAAWQYALSVPAVIKSGGSGDVCINFMYHNESLDVTIDYEVDGVNHTILKEKIPPKNTFKCVKFKVVNVTSNLPVFISLVAAGVSNIIRDRKTMVIVTMNKLNLVQTDKSIYKPGQTVYCRLISLDSNLMPVEETYTAVYLLDPNRSRLSQLLNLESEEGIAAFQFDLLPDASLGNYQIMAEKLSGGTVTRNVDVQLYDLPRFTLTLEAPGTISIMDKTIEINATSKYTYGQGVPGNITVRICRSYSGYYPGNACNRNPEGICVTSTGQMGADGIYGGSIDLTVFQMDRTGLAMSLSIQATLSEEGTGVQVIESQYVSVTSQLAQLTFDSEIMQQYYKRNIPYFISVRLVNAVGHPIPDENITLQVNGKVIQNLTTNADGRAEYELDTSSYVQPQLDIQALYKNGEQCYDPNWVMPSYSNAYFTATRFYSRTRSFVQVQGPREELKCGQNYQINVQYSLSTQGLGKDVKTASFYYLAMSKVQIVQHGEQSVDVSNSLQGEFNFNLQGSYELAPVVDVIVYSIMLSEVIAHTVHLKVEKCFKNEVSMNFSKAEGIPGSSVDLKLGATPRSLCGLRVVDSSVELLNPNSDLSPEMVYMAMQLTSLNGYYVGGYNVEEPAPPCSDGDQEIFVDGIYYKPTSFSGEGDSYEEFKSVGLIFATNASIIKPQVCGSGAPPIYYRPGVPNAPMFEASSPIRNVAFAAAAPEDMSFGRAPTPVPVTTIRKFFPESWNFNITAVGPDGSVSLPLTVPDTITSWKATGFCNSAQTGFGMTKSPANFTSFIPFFGEITYPQIITRGEVMTLRAFVSNYLGKCIKVRVTLPESKDYTAVLQEGSQEACLCDKQRASYVWNMRNFSLGEITLNVTAQTTHIGDSCTGPADPTQPPRLDQVIKSLTVEPEGIEKELTYSNFVCVKDTSSVVQISITPEANSVPGSHRASVTVIGDLMGNAANNLAHLIRMPTGCGEQNLATLLPIPFVVKYLNCTEQLTDALLEKAKAAMQQGYQRSLQYKRYDGSFGAFGFRDTQGSSWLTLLHLIAYDSISEYVFVDEKVTNQALISLQRSQDLNTGCFNPTGTLFNSALKGGPDKQIGFTAAVLIALIRRNYSGVLVSGGMRCMDTASRTEGQSLFNRIMMFCLYRLSGNMEISNALLAQLKKEAIAEAGSVHWQLPNMPKPKNSPFFYTPASSGDVEMTSYVLLGMTYGPPPSEEEKAYMAQMTLWLSSQQNSLGGYQSSADTIVAVQALSRYICMIYLKNATNHVQVTSGNSVIAQFNVEPQNRLLVQKKPLPNASGQYSFNVSGRGCCLVQSTVLYNVPVAEENSAFALYVKTSSESCVNGVAFTFTMNFNASYHGSQNQSNMVIIDIKLLSGYDVSYTSLNQLKQKVARVDKDNNHLFIYLNWVSSDTQSYSLQFEMSSTVQNVQPQFVYIYDYYNKAENGVAVLRHPCSA